MYKGQDALVLLDGTPLDQLEDKLKSLKGQIYYGGWKGNNLSWRAERALPEYQHLVLGWRMGYCMKSHVEYLQEQEVPTQNIHVLSRYSFCCKDPKDIQEATNYYKGKGIDVFEGRVKEILKG